MSQLRLPGLQDNGPLPVALEAGLRARPDLWRLVAKLCADPATAEPCWHDQRNLGRSGGPCRMNTEECPG